ncbi:hypothetical protein NP233_g3765 [Leucocoprinus birnbaumii]|uniref:14-3-3 domain-containing protein n=1 Tax=Leucocoprinus birnbaumii TaxID=56174 RepID=A0AAD5YSI6_9AGAR|nr:hypothetical protein NP233_g3765 [Leucocoprinus birnbaumii]
MPCHKNLPDAIDLSHHLSKVARAREVSPLKGLQKYLGRKDIIMLAGGLPHPDLFPFEDVSASVYPPNAFPSNNSTKPSFFSWITSLFSHKGQTWEKLKIRRYAKETGDLNLAQLLQYGLSSGLPDLQKLLQEIVERIYQPAYGNWKVLIHTGNTDGWAKAIMTLCDPGDTFLTSEWTYPSAISAATPLGFKAVPIPMDNEGERSDALLVLLSTWDENVRGAPRPRVMYTVPIGQNPTGATMHLERKKEIYDICVKFGSLDVIIVEDDPYFFLQEGLYTPRQDRVMHKDVSNEAFLASLCSELPQPPISIDYQGRVLRLDSFSKTIAPGSRLGWFTCNALFAERLERQSETSTQAPSGFTQGLLTALLLNWKFDGYVRWLRGLRAQYTERRDLCIDLFHEFFELQEQSPGVKGTPYNGYLKSRSPEALNYWAEKFDDEVKQRPVISFVPPTSGMFLWLQINFDDHPSFNRLGRRALENRICTEFAEAGVLVGPGFIFSPRLSDSEEDGPGHVRLSFSNADVRVQFRPSREECLFVAELASESERYQDVVSQIKFIVNQYGAQLTIDERNLLSIAYKNLTNSLRNSWRILDSQEMNLVRHQREKVEKELADVCKDIVNLLDRQLLPSASAGEETVFYSKMKGDYFRYLAEFALKKDRERYGEQSLNAYKVAYKHAQAMLEPLHPTRLGLALNFSVFYHDVRKSPERACHLAKSAFDDAIQSLDQANMQMDQTMRDSLTILQLLRDDFDPVGRRIAQPVILGRYDNQALAAKDFS